MRTSEGRDGLQVAGWALLQENCDGRGRVVGRECDGSLHASGDWVDDAGAVQSKLVSLLCHRRANCVYAVQVEDLGHGLRVSHRREGRQENGLGEHVCGLMCLDC